MPVSLLSPAPVNAQSDQDWLLAQINNLRANLGLHAYVWNSQLAAAAQQHSEYMAATGDISHEESNGSTPQSRAVANGYTGSFVSENIYGGTLAQANDAWSFWLNSSVHYAGMAHRRNNEIGIGVAAGANGRYYTLVFGYRADLSAPPAQPISPPPVGDGSGVATVAPAPVVQGPPPTRRPPTLTFTPSPTVPTSTPTITWTPTFTWTPSPTLTPAPDTPTPVYLPTAAPVAFAPSVEALHNADNAVVSPPDTAPEVVKVTQDEDGLEVPLPLVLLLIGQGLLIGAGVYSVFFRKTR